MQTKGHDVHRCLCHSSTMVRAHTHRQCNPKCIGRGYGFNYYKTTSASPTAKLQRQRSASPYGADRPDRESLLIARLVLSSAIKRVCSIRPSSKRMQIAIPTGIDTSTLSDNRAGNEKLTHPGRACSPCRSSPRKPFYSRSDIDEPSEQR